MSQQSLSGAEYKKAVEARIMNNDGTTFLEVFLVCSILVPAVFLCQLLRRYTFHSRLLSLIVEYFTLCLPMLIAVTSNNTVLIYAFIGSMTILAFLIAGLQWRSSATPTNKSPLTVAGGEVKKELRHHQAFFDAFRSGLMLFTCLCILAVDFPIFPNRFMKTETFGISLMDTGVGSFVFSAAVAFGAKMETSRSTTFNKKWLGSAIPLIFLGSMRLFIIWGTDYQEHVSEYGKHWNFFYTLALLPILFVSMDFFMGKLSSFIYVPLHRSFTRIPAYQASVFAVVYQCALSFFGLTEFIQSAERNNVFEANKEGIFSSVGYMAIFLSGIQIGKHALRPRASKVEYRRAAGQLLVVDLCLWLLTLTSELYVQPCSRRMCNLTYILFTLALNTGFLSAFQFIFNLPSEISATFSQSQDPTILSGINLNQLAIFLVANLSTGAVNLSMQTIFASSMVSYLVLCCYLLEISAVALVWQHFGIVLKVW